MIKNIITILFLQITLYSYGQKSASTNINGIIINPNIKSEVEKYIHPSKEFDEVEKEIQLYENSFLGEYYKNDKLELSSNDSSKKMIFKSCYYWINDTLNIDGAFGLFGGSGFGIKITKDKEIVYHLLSSDESPSYAYKENDSLLFRLEVPCTDYKIILSELPNSSKKQIIYGYVEFKSKDYYASAGSVEDKEILPRIKLRSNMKIYFKSGFMKF
jgi:hypothetical protein